MNEMLTQIMGMGASAIPMSMEAGREGLFDARGPTVATVLRAGR